MCDPFASRPRFAPFLGLLVFALAGALPGVSVRAQVTTVRNPIIPGFHPDPSVVRVGEDYYLVTSTFEFFPGVPVFHSRDMVNWRLIGHALTRDSQLPLQGARPSGGIYAPTIRHHAGTFYMITTNVTGGGNFYVTATNPAGPWSEPVYVKEQGGIDPSLFFDEDGTVYLLSTGGAPGTSNERGIYQSAIDIATGRLTSPPRLVWRGTGGRYPEGPHMYRVNGRYYLMISEGGTEYGHMVTIARSPSPWGPFEPCPRNPVVTHRDTYVDQPIQATGHPDLVQDPGGRWWMVLLAVRPQGGRFHHLGRETFLAPVAWDEAGWPVVNGGRGVELAMSLPGITPEPSPAPPVRTAFDEALGPEWNHVRNPDRAMYSLDARKGWLALRGTSTTLGDIASPTFVGRRQQHLGVRVATRVDFVPAREGEEAGLSVFHNATHRYEIGLRRRGAGREVFLRQTIGPSLSAVTASAEVTRDGPVELEVAASPLEYTFSCVDAGGTRRRLGVAQTRYVSSEVAGGFTGVYFGLYATGAGSPASAPAFFDWFDYEPAGNVQ
jgi:alpha-N-arabinofuranosidase